MAGAQFYKIDVHVHSPGSGDWETDDTTPDDLIAAAVDARLDVIALTDHNTAEWCDRLRAAAKDSPLVVLPGCEISTSEGHLLAIFPEQTPASDIEDLLVGLGFPRPSFGDTDTIVQKPIDVVAKVVDEAGGLAIPAHVCGEKGFWKHLAGNGARRKAVYSCPAIRAVEEKDPDVASQFVNGSLDGYERRVPVLSGSDAHRIEDVGRRFAQVKMGTPGFNGLLHAFDDSEMRVKASTETIPGADVTINKIEVTGGFFDDEVIEFNRGLNTLVGGTGCGKSTVLEFLRWALDQPVDGRFEDIAREVAGRLKYTLGSGPAVVRVWCTVKGMDYLVERAWTEETGSADSVVARLDLPEDPLEGVVPGDLVSIQAFSQGQVLEYARSDISRLSLVDQSLDLSGPDEVASGAQRDLGENAREIVTLMASAQTLASAEDGLEDLRTRAQKLQEILGDQAVEGHEAWERASSKLKSAGEVVDDAYRLVEEARDEVAALTIAGAEDPSPSGALGEVIELHRQEVRDLLTRLDQMLAIKQETAESLKAASAPWQDERAAHQAQYHDAIANLDEDNRGAASLVRTLEVVNAQITEREEKLRRLADEVQPRLDRLHTEREELLNRLAAARREIREARRKRAGELTEAMESRVRIRIDKYVGGEPYREALVALASGSGLRKAFLDAISGECEPTQFVRSLLGQEFDRLSEVSGQEAHNFAKLHDFVFERNRIQELFDLQGVEVSDGASVQFTEDGQAYRDIEALAHGQKCTAILMIALAEGSDPLLVDQPEDALHAPWMEDYLVPLLRKRRGQRQCIFASRSANLIVSPDADQIVALKADADKGGVERSGSLEEFDTKALVLHHVEGGSEAFRLRALKYGRQA